MKKSLIALAALASVAGVAQAQSSVTVYGLLDVGYTNISENNGDYKKASITTADGGWVNQNGTAGTLGQSAVQPATKLSKNALAFSNDNSSRWGITGVEDLGGGLKANFKIEQGIGTNAKSTFGATQNPGATRGFLNGSNSNSTTTGNGSTLDMTVVGNRELNAGLDFTSTGTRIQAGYGSTPVRGMQIEYDAVASNNIGNLLANEGKLGSNRSTALSVIQTVGNVTATAQMMLNSDSGATSAADVKSGTGWLGALRYAAGPVSIGGAHQVAKTKSAVGTAATAYTVVPTASCTAAVDLTTTTTCPANITGYVDKTVLTAAALATDVKTTVDLVGASYNLGVASLFAQYGRVKTDDAATVNANGEGKRSAYSVGARVPLGKLTLSGQVSDGSVNQSTYWGQAAVKRDWTGFTVAARYELSKRTYAYAVYGETKLDASPVASQLSAIDGEFKYKQTSIGIAHAF